MPILHFFAEFVRVCVSYLNQNRPMHASAVTTMDATMMTTGRVAINFPHLQENGNKHDDEWLIFLTETR